jgi:Tol biopolymer transport system component
MVQMWILGLGFAARRPASVFWLGLAFWVSPAFGDGLPADGGPMSASSDSMLPFLSGVEVSDWIRPGEKHFKRLWQLTNGGENAEAYWSWDGKDLILQSTPRGSECDQIYLLPAGGGKPQMVSTGKGRCTCSYFFPGDREIVFSSTHLADPACPSKPDFSNGYVWAIYRGYEVFKANRDGTNLVRLTDEPGYDAEATVGPDGDILFTSDRTGDLELYRMRSDGSDVRRITSTPGYDGGAFFSTDGKRICWRASRPEPGQELDDYRALLVEGLIRPGKLEIMVADSDGRNAVQLTDNGAANFCPYFHPGGKKVIFVSNFADPKKRNFDLYLVDIATKELERVTTEETFDGFPMFSPDGKRLVFASNRGAERPGETNIFVAEWAD